ncbi:MAG: Uma2 family endonuclease, partial [Bacteroidota bacterium]
VNMVETIEQKNPAQKNIPSSLIYEMDDGKPIYYKDYLDVLNNIKTFDQIVSCSILQSLLIELIKNAITEQLDKSYIGLSNELGILFEKYSWRAADIAFFKKKQITQLDEREQRQFVKFAPELVIEIDIKADADSLDSILDDIHKKTQQLLDFGVYQVVWIFTKSKKITLAQNQLPWMTYDWDADLTLMENVQLNIANLLEEFYGEE